MKKLLYLFIAALVITVLLNSCEKKTIDLGSGDEPYNPTAPADSVRFNADIIPVFTTECTGCHSIGGGLQPELEASVAYSSIIDGGYVNTSNPSNSILYTTIEPVTTLHGGGQHKTAADKILVWIQQGAKNN
jgi:hypothetical protein